MINNSLEIIKHSNILAQSELAELASYSAELQNTFETVQIFHTRTEMEVSILNDIRCPTPDAKYWQSIRQQNVMFVELVMLSYEYRKNVVEIKKLERKLTNQKDDLEQELLQIEIEKKRFISIQQARTAKDRIREIKAWSEIKNGLKDSMKFSLIDVNEHQLISYTQRYIREFLSTQNANIGFAEKRNQAALLETALDKCNTEGVLEKVLEPFKDTAFAQTVRERSG